MKRDTQYAAIGELIQREEGATPAELIAATWSTCVHKRMSEMRARGWDIRREQIEGRSYGRYFGQAPKA
jgi:hypothetical protein